MLYKLTGEITYLSKARRAADYVINNMCTAGILKYENGYEQGIYAAIYAQYIKMLVYECDLSLAYVKKYLTHIQKNLQKAYTNMDAERGIQIGYFAKKTASTDVVESYGASGMPALMLMFPASDTATPIADVVERKYDGPSDVYTPDGKLVMKDATPEQVREFESGLYIFQRKKILVK